MYLRCPPWALAFALASVPSLGRAQPSEPASEEAPSVADDTASATLDAEARALFEAALTAFEARRYEAALEYFQRSYDLSRRPQLLYNIATAADRARQDRVALDAYRQYLELTPPAPEHELANNRIETLQRILGEGAAASPEEDAGPGPAEPDAATPSASDRTSEGSDATPWGVVVIGAATAIVGGVLLGVGLADQAAVEDPAPGTRWDDVEDAYDRGPGLLTSGLVILPIGVAALGAGLLWALLGVDGEEQALLRPHGLGVRGAF